MNKLTSYGILFGFLFSFIPTGSSAQGFLHASGTYIYDGNSQVLDQIFASPGMVDSLVGVVVVHVNSEYYYQDRLSDHDPVLALFDLN